MRKCTWTQICLVFLFVRRIFCNLGSQTICFFLPPPRIHIREEGVVLNRIICDSGRTQRVLLLIMVVHGTGHAVMLFVSHVQTQTDSSVVCTASVFRRGVCRVASIITGCRRFGLEAVAWVDPIVAFRWSSSVGPNSTEGNVGLSLPMPLLLPAQFFPHAGMIEACDGLIYTEPWIKCATAELSVEVQDHVPQPKLFRVCESFFFFCWRLWTSFSCQGMHSVCRSVNSGC